MSKIILINAPITPQTEYGLLNEGISVGGPPLSLLYLAAVTRKENFETKIIDCLTSQFNHKKAVDVILQESPKYVGITATSVSIYSAAKLAMMIKEAKPEIITIVGGAHIISIPEQTMSRFPQFDIGVTGEGEITLIELLNAIENKGDLENIEGLVIRKDTQFYITPRRPLIKDLDTLPMPAWDLLPDFPHKYQPPLYRLTRLPAAFLVTSRGCPYHRCSFCDRSFLGSSYRVHSLDYVFEMIKTLVGNYNIRDLTIYDEDFTSHKSRLIKFCERMKGERLNLVWSCSGRTNLVTRETIRIMEKAGCRAISLGIESAVPEILEIYKKRIDLEHVEEVLRWSIEAGMVTDGFFMIGGPLETEETIKKSLDFAKSVDLDFMSLAYFTPFPGTEIRKEIERYGTFNEDWQKMSQVEPVFVPKGLTEDKLRYWYRRGILEFYLRPKMVLSLIKNLKKAAWFIRILRGGITMLKIVLKVR